jgi:hypothetical protein
VGIEILLDLTLGQSAPAQAAYLSGLAAGLRPELVSAVAWSTSERERLVDLIETLVQRGILLDTSSPIVVERIRRTLARRPRLALKGGDTESVLDWVESSRDRVVGSALALVAELYQELERRQRA